MNNVPTVAWTTRHIEELDRIFPEVVDTTDVNKLLVNAGKRQVVNYIRSVVHNNRKPVHD